MDDAPQDAPIAGRGTADDAFAQCYAELKRIARRELARAGGPSGSLSATTLVHEAYAGLAARDDVAFRERGQFLAYAARAMRHFIIDAARERRALKRGGEFHITRLDTQLAQDVPDVAEHARLSDALDALAADDPRLAQLVDLKYFCGFTFAEIAALHGVTERTVQRDWQKARLLLFAELERSGSA